MKRLLSLVLAAMLAASALTGCETGPSNKETEVTETNSPETSVRETVPAETDGTELAFPTDRLTENGAATAAIVLPEGSDSLVQLASEELQYHIKKVSGADVSVVSSITADTLSIVIGTPDTVPELAEMFPEDIAWLAEIGKVGDTERYGDDGFAIRRIDGTIYIFGNTAKGALNGTYDFIEENMDVLWIRANEEIGLVYEEMPTIAVKSVNYREKSPFQYRGWHFAGFKNPENDDSERMIARNKMNSSSHGAVKFGLQKLGVNHNIKNFLRYSPLYDPTVTEYWETDEKGNHLNMGESKQINFWSDLAVEAVAATVIQHMKDTGIHAVFVGIEDTYPGRVYPEDTLPFEYAEGQFVTPADSNYLSTVYFTFINKVARLVRAEYPDGIIQTFAYFFTKNPPACTLEDNVLVVQATIEEDVRAPINDESNTQNSTIYHNLENWKNINNNTVFYNYYGCFPPAPLYCRPIWYRIQADLQYYAESGFLGVQPEGQADDGSNYGWDIIGDVLGSVTWKADIADFTNSDEWATNALTFWLYGKLAWNPYEDVDALIEEFCEKVYGNGADYMKEYYAILYKGWVDGVEIMKEEYVPDFTWSTHPMTLYDYFVNYDSEIRDGLLAALTNAYEAAEDTAKVRIGEMKELFEQYIREFEI